MAARGSEGHSPDFKEGLSHHDGIAVPSKMEAGEYKNRILIFGGRYGGTHVSGILYSIKLMGSTYHACHPETKGVSPSPRFSHTCTYLPSEDMMVVAGGVLQNGCFTESIYGLMLMTNSWVHLSRKSKMGHDLSNNSAIAYHSVSYTS